VLALATFCEIDESQFESANMPETLAFKIVMGLLRDCGHLRPDALRGAGV
jgi:hypothetical protein